MTSSDSTASPSKAAILSTRPGHEYFLKYSNTNSTYFHEYEYEYITLKSI